MNVCACVCLCVCARASLSESRLNYQRFVNLIKVYYYYLCVDFIVLVLRCDESQRVQSSVHHVTESWWDTKLDWTNTLNTRTWH